MRNYCTSTGGRTDAPRPDGRRALGRFAMTMLVAGTLLGGCASSRVVSVRNRGEAPVNVTFWTSERIGGFEQTWQGMQGQADRIDAGKHKAFHLGAYRKAADPVLRMQVVTRGASWETAYNYWFEVVSTPPMKITLSGPPDRILAQSNHGEVEAVPWDLVPKERQQFDEPIPAPKASDGATTKQSDKGAKRRSSSVRQQR